VAITVDSFNYKSNYPGLADNRRPIWAIEQGPGVNAKPPVESEEVSQPGSGQTAYLNTWALGALPAGKTRTFVWKVIPVKPGAHTVTYAVNAGLAGKAKARLAGGGPATGKLTVNIAGSPPVTHVDPKTGKVVTGVQQRARRFRHAVIPFGLLLITMDDGFALDRACPPDPFFRRIRPTPCQGPASRTSPPHSGASTEAHSGLPT
jgi:hypothetical protein